MQNKKFFLAAAAACLTTGFAAAQDECATAAIAVAGAQAFDTTTATPSAEAWTCVSGAANDVWFTYTAVGTFGLDIDLCGSTYDTAIAVYDGTCGALNLIECDDDFCGLQSGVATISQTPGTTYYIRIGGFSSSNGMGTLNITDNVFPVNDECANAIALAAGPNAYDSTGASTSSPWPCAAGGSDVWYTYTAAGAGGLTVSLCGSTYDTCLEIFEGDCGSLTSIACNDDFCGLQSEISITQIPGATYTFRVGGFAGNTGAGTIDITDVMGILNDECTGAFLFPVSEGINGPYDTTTATTSSTWPCALGGSDLWFNYTPTFSGDFTIQTCGVATTYDTALELFEGDCGSLVSAVCNDDNCGLQSGITYCGVAGTTYTFRMGGFNANSGMGEIEVIGAPDPGNCVTTLFATNNGGAVGGAVFFDATLTQAALVGSIATNTSVAVGQAINADVYTTPGTSVGVEQNMAAWTLVGTVSGVAAGIDNPSWMSTSTPIALGAGTFGMAIVAQDFNHRYTNGNGTNQSAVSGDGVITLTLGKGQNTPFVSGPFSPRVWNGIICRTLPIGVDYCPATANSTGATGALIVTGSDCVSADGISLVATGLPTNSFGYFLCSRTMGMIPAGQGNICFSSDIGRGVGGSVFNSGAAGVMSTSTNLTLPQPTGAVQVVVGETWNFQLWHRDSVGGMATSNTTNGHSVLFR